MDQGLRRASAACILLILGIGLQHNSQAADVIFFNQSFGPFFLQDSQLQLQTKNTQKPAAESFPVTPPSTESHPPEISSFQSLLIKGVEQVTTEVAVREEDLSMIHSEKPTSSGTESPILYSSVNTNEASEISAQNSEIEKSLVNQTGPPSSVSAEIPPISEDEYCIETEIYTLSEDLPVSTTQSEFLISSSVVWNSKMESSMVTLQPSLISQFGISEEHTLEVFSGQNRPSSEIANLQSSYLQSKINSEDATTIATRKALQSVFLNIGLSAANELSTSPYSTPFSTAVELPYLEYGVFSSEDFDFPATSPLMKNYESTMAAYSTPVPTLTLYNDQTLILSSHVVSTDLMKNDLDSITFKPVESSGYSLHSSLFSEKEHFEESATEELYGLYSSMFPLSSTHGEGFVPSLDFTSLVDTSLIGNPATTHLHVYNTDLETNIFFVLDSSVYMPSLTEIVSATTFVDFDSDPSTSIHIAASKTFTEHSFSTSMNTVEAAAFVPTESVLYFSQSLIPLEESENINHHLSMMFTLEPSIPLPSLSEDGLLSSSKSSESSVLLSQGSSIILATSELFLNSSLLEPSFSPTSESIRFEGSGLMPWQTSNNYLAASLSPVSRIDEFEENSSVFSQPAELWEQTTALQSETDILYTSSFSGATSPLMPLSTPTSFTFPITELSAYSLDSNDYSTTLVEETIELSFAFSHSLMLDLATTMSSFFETSTHTVVLPESTLPIPTITPAENLSEFPTGSIIPSTSLSEPNYMLSTPLIPTSPTNITDDASSIFSTVAPEATKDSNFTTTDATWIANPEITTTANASWTMISDVTSNTSSTTANALWTLSVEVTTNNSVVTVIPETNVNITTEKMGWTEASETVTNTSIITATIMRTVTPAIITTSNTVGTVTREATTAHTINEETTAITTENLTAASTQSSSTQSVPITPPSGLTAATSPTTTRQTLVCDVSNPEPYLVTAVLFRGSNIENAIESIKQMLTQQFNRSVELEVYTLSQRLSFIITSGPLVYTAIAVCKCSDWQQPPFGLLTPHSLHRDCSLLGLDQKFHIQTVLQFVPRSVDIRLCTFSDQIQRGLSMALYEVRRLRQEDDNFSVQIVNITLQHVSRLFWKAPVTVSYAVKERNSFLNGSEVSEQLRNLSLVEFSSLLGYPVKQIAEPSRYPQLNVSPLLKESWLRTVLLGVMEPKFRDEAFQAEMERKLAQLIIEATARKRRWKRASVAGGNTVQVVNITRLDGSDDPVQLIYFIEDQYGERLSAARASDLINEVNIQRAAIILGYRVQGAVSQPLDQPLESDQQAQNLWIIVGVAVPVLLVTVIIVILYWKLCRSDKLDFQPDTMSNLQQRQKLQAPSVKGFDFAKQHLGQHNKDEVLVVHEPPPPVLHGPLKDSTPSENGDVPTPKSKSSSKPPKVGRHRGSRVTPSDAGSSASDASSGKESAGEGSPRPSAPPRETKPRSSINRDLPAIITGNEQHSSASIFEHVDRISRSSEASRRFPSKIQLIAMQPITAPPMHGLSMSEREMEANKINREIQTTLRHKSEIEHHRNKIRLRAKRKGHYEFPLVDVVGMTDTKERQRMYRKVQMQFDKILDPGSGIPTVFIEPRRSSRTRRSPKQRRRQQGSGSPSDADRDRLINTDSDGTYKRPPGVSNSAYVSDPDLPSDNPTPVSDLGKFPGSSLRAPPAQYVAPQPSIEEVRQTMQSLLDDAFALVAPSSQTAGGTGGGQTGGSSGPISSSTARTGRGTAPWSSAYPQQTTHFNRFTDYGMTQASAPSHMTRSPGFGSGFLPPGEIAQTEAEQAESQYNTRGMYSEEIASVARPRPLGSTSGSSQIHQLAQVGIASRMGAQTEMPPSRVGQAPTAGTGWSQYCHPDEEVSRNVHHRDPGHSHGSQDYGAPQMFPLNRAPARQPGNNTHVPPPICYPSGSAEDLHPGHSSASLIKAIREELLRLSQKHAVVPTYHS
ncbi:LOW QUALITY PROTEIN: UPF0606 protein KIAA1549 homolog [Bombina bombina]|uniref:LOW QUALITY PROTEIN: UPF0606 protein KIAA1549 homolog n=1 Tax=Bombina bombina TaxID=8345 RepID=UPI00235A9608|nr:LOW QUALITY PROTEIN: UPF0606 protein KIAA1549 homolog [Bombina bombina]